MLVRRARPLVLTLPPAGLQAFNFLTRQGIPCDPLSVDILARAGDWSPAPALVESYPPPARPAVDTEVRRLVEATCLVVAGTPAAARDAQYEAEWAWGETAGLYHFSLKECEFLPTPQANQWLEYQTQTTPAPPLYRTNAEFGSEFALERPKLDEGIFSIMSARRSERVFRPDPIPVEALSECLFAGLGITGFLDVPIPGHAPLPLKMAPSGGGRNPYEAYVYAQRVDGLPAGIYHYSAVEHSLAVVREPPLPPPRLLFGGQEWTDGAAAIILLVAHFQRTMWKYPHPSAYRVVLIEAGHIGQNIALAAATHDLAAIPVAALNDTLDSEVLGIDFVNDSVVCGLILGSRPEPGAEGVLERQLFSVHE
ncbi:MAG: SagB/ThcOx family dehydrogenase [Acidimicrobiales bacterium]